MRLFDLHCDTLSRCLETGEPLERNSGQLDLERGKRFPWIQAFACFLDAEDRGEAALEKFLSMRRLLLDTAGRCPGLTLWEGEEPEAGVCSALLTVEGGQALAGRLENVERFARWGVRLLTLVWNGDNELGSGACDGMNRGLTSFGRECLREMERCGITADISHLNDQGIGDVFTLSARPVIASHSNLRSVHGHPRNLTEEQFRQLVRQGGLCGLNYYPLFVSGEADCGPEALRRHLERMLELGGENCVALGSDFDGAGMPSFLRGLEGIGALYGHVAKWYGFLLADRLFYQNAFDFFARGKAARALPSRSCQGD